MFAHVTIGSNDVDRAMAFYDAVLEPLGLRQTIPNSAGTREVACWAKGTEPLPKFFVVKPYDDKDASAGNGTMVAFTASSSVDVDAAYKAGLASGGTDEGAPGPRPQYGDGYYGAYLRDLDGNKVHLVFRGDLA